LAIDHVPFFSENFGFFFGVSQILRRDRTGGASDIVKAESSAEDPRATGGLVSNLPHPRVNKTKQHTVGWINPTVTTSRSSFGGFENFFRRSSEKKFRRSSSKKERKKYPSGGALLIPGHCVSW